MYCRYCSHLIPDGAAFCPTCGRPVPEDEATPADVQIDGFILYKRTRLRDYYVSLDEPRMTYDEAVKKCEQGSLPTKADIQKLVEGRSADEIDELNARIIAKGGVPLAKLGEERFYWLRSDGAKSMSVSYYSALTGCVGSHSKASRLSVRLMFYKSRLSTSSALM